MRKRAKSQEETRQRIVEATMHLHQEIGPRATTISAIAERAGVQRLTVYRHFTDEAAVFEACTAHWLQLNPPPEPSDWRGIDDPSQQLGAALAAFYGYYGETRQMWAAALRDVDDVPALQGPMARFADYVAGIGAELIDGTSLQEAAREMAETTLLHALSFPTWADLEARGVDNPAKVVLVLRWLQGIKDSVTPVD